MVDNNTQFGNDGQQNDLKRQDYDIKNVLQVNLLLAYGAAANVSAHLTQGNRLPPMVARTFFREFYNVYFFLKAAVPSERFDPELKQHLDDWFDTARGNLRNTNLVADGVFLFHKLTELMATWKIGLLFEKGIDPPFVLESEVDLEFNFGDDEL